MNHTLPLLCTLMLLGACATTPTGNPGRIQTTDQANRENLVGAASSPLRDMNVLRTKVPTVLVDALADPYATPPSRSCETLAGLIGPLTEALGPDLDVILAEVKQTGQQMVGDCRATLQSMPFEALLSSVSLSSTRPSSPCPSIRSPQ
jgi:hypothetical protein